jgi:hypothetical protein
MTTRLPIALLALLATSGAANPPVLKPAVTSAPVTLTGITSVIPILAPSVGATTVTLVGISATIPNLATQVTAPSVVLTGTRKTTR